MSVTGHGGGNAIDGTGQNSGVHLTGNGVISSGIGGNVMVLGTGGVGMPSATATGGVNIGVLLDGGTQITSGGSGNVSIDGTGGSGGIRNAGVLVESQNVGITSGGSGTVNVKGTGGSSSGTLAGDLDYGVWVFASVSNPSTITSGGGGDHHGHAWHISGRDGH